MSKDIKMSEDIKKDRAAWTRLTAWIMAHPWPILIIGILITILSGAISPTIKSSADPTAYIPRNREAVRFWLDFNKRFGVLTTMMVGLEEPEKPFTIKGLQQLKKITKQLEKLKSEGILSVRSITNIQHMEKDRETGTVEAGLLLSKLPKTKKERKQAMTTVLNDMQVPGALISRDLRGYIILIQPDSKKNQNKLAALVGKVVARDKGHLRAYYFGAPFIANEVTRDVYRKLPWIAPLFVLLLFIVLAVTIRHLWASVLVLSATGLTLVWWLAMMHAAHYELTITNINAILLLLGVGVLVFGRGAQTRLANTTHPFITWVLLPVGAIAFIGVAAFSRHASIALPYLALFGEAMAIGLLAMALVWLFIFLPLVSFIRPDPPKAVDRPPLRISQSGATLALVFIALFGLFGSMRIPFAVGLNDLFMKKGPVGQMQAFFDRRFGGHDFIQVSVKADLRDPDNAARLMRATDLMEGSKAFADVRSITQVLGTLAQGMGNSYRIPVSRDALANIWFFLEGNTDVSPLVSGDRKEAMLALRIPAKGNAKNLAGIIRKAMKDSAVQGVDGARLRLTAMLSYYGVDLPPGRLGKVLAGAGQPDKDKIRQDITKKVRQWMRSDDSPFNPNDEEWQIINAEISKNVINVPELTDAIAKMQSFKSAGFPMKVAGKIATVIKEKVRALGMNIQVETLISELFKGQKQLPDALKTRVRGMLDDMLHPHKTPGKLKVVVSGFPLIAPVVASDLRRGIWITAGVLFILFLLFSLLLAPFPRAGFTVVTDGVLAALLTGGMGWATGIGVDSGSATLYLIPTLAGIFLSPGFYHDLPFEGRKFPVGFALGLAASALAILAAGVLPVMRVGAVMAMGLLSAIIVTGLTRILWRRQDW